MDIKLLKGDCSCGNFDQNTIWEDDTKKKMKCLMDFNGYKEAFDWLIQAINDEEIDVANSFYSYTEEE